MRLKFIAKNCVGCEDCTLVCSLVHEGVTGLALGRIKITRNYPSLEDPLIKGYFCRQCKKAKCVEACPVQALTQGEDLVNFDQELCTGCGACVEACPFHSIWMNQKTGLPFKCDTCQGDPSCVKICPHEALKWE